MLDHPGIDINKLKELTVVLAREAIFGLDGLALVAERTQGRRG